MMFLYKKVPKGWSKSESIGKGGQNAMNARQQQMIRVLRGLGKGYKFIAKDMNLPLNMVRCYCRYHGLTGYASKQMFGENRGKALKKPKPVFGACKNCGVEIYYHDSVPGRKRKFCCEQCRYAYWNSKKHKGG